MARHCVALFIALMVSACGGEDSNSQSSSASPSPPASPTPNAAIANVAISSIGLTVQQEYTTLGYSYTLITHPDDGIDHNEVSQWDDLSLISFKYLANLETFGIGIPGLGERQLSSCQISDADAVFCRAGEEPISRRQLGASLLRPDSASLSLRWTSVVEYYTGDGTTVTTPTTLYGGIFAYGVPAPVSKIPTAGIANGTARIGALPQVPGTLQLDYANRRLDGSFSYTIGPNEYDPNSVAVSYNITLSGDIATDGKITGTFGGDAVAGSFEGIFTGPEANELMLRMQYSVVNQGVLTPRYTALAGKLN